jgi:predicted NBD/HSP70 family sugar kinase
MPKAKNIARFFKTCPGSKEEQIRLNIFEVLKSGQTFSPKEISKKAGVSKDSIAAFINNWVKEDLLKLSGTGKEGLVEFISERKKVLGIGFGEDECILVAIDLAGNVLTKEHVSVEIPRKAKLKNKEIEQIVAKIKQKSRLTGEKFSCAGIALPDEIGSANPKSAEILAKGIKSIWKTDVFIAKKATAAGYGEKDFDKKGKLEAVIYMHSDIGIGAVVKKEAIFEADERSQIQDSVYLKPWNQFSVVHSSRRLIDKGVGTDIVGMVGGNVDRITLGTVLKAAKNKDELAEDLVKRSALALGVRIAYLVNMFGIENVVLGGGVEVKEGDFIEYVRESANKFILNKAAKKLKIIPGILGEEASSIGAACLCRRKLFMEE